MVSAKKPKKITNPDDLLPLGENDRNICVVFHGQLAEGFDESFQQLQSSNIIVQAKLKEEVERFTLTEALNNEILGAQVAPASKKDPNLTMKAVVNDAGHVTFTLTQHRITLSLPVLGQLCSGFSDERVSFHAPAAGEVAPSPAVKGKKGEGVKHGKDKRKISIVPSSIGACLAQVDFRFEDIMLESSKRYYIDLGKAAPFLASCWVELVSHDFPLAPPFILQKYRPVSVVINAVEIATELLAGSDVPLPVDTSAAPSGDELGEGLPSAAPKKGDGNNIYAVIDCLGHTITTPPLPIRRCGTGEMEANSDAAPALFRTMIFLGHSTPLRVLQRIMFDFITVSVYREENHEKLLDDEESISQIHYGSSAFSIKTFIENNQTFFSESLQLLPNRTSLTKTESALTSGCTVSMNLDFFIPFSAVEHVSELGEPKEGWFMTRGVMVMPYAPDWAEAAIGTFLREVLKKKRAGADSDVTAFVPIEVQALPVDEAPPKKGKEKKKGGSEGKKGSTSRGSSKDSKKGKKGKAQPPTPPPPPTKTAFEEPFKVISPEGISGFEVIDGEIRLICLEGPGPEVHHILKSTAEACRYPPELKILFNSEVFIPARRYVRFPPLVTPPDLTKKPKRQEKVQPGIVIHDDALKAPDKDGEGGVEAEAGGTGGRVHRIRLREALSVLVKQQRYLLHRTLSESCLSCFQNLFALSQCETIFDAIRRHYFPAAADLISLERSFGQTLDLTDIFARTDYVNMSDILAEDAAKSSYTTTTTVPRVHEVDVTSLTPEDIGLLTSFQGRLLAKSRRIPTEVTRRYCTCKWMCTQEGDPVLCAFPRDVPGGTIKYEVEGQVVCVGQTLLLYVMEFHTISNSITSSKNPNYEEFLRRRRWCQKQLALLAGEHKRQERRTITTLPTIAPISDPPLYADAGDSASEPEGESMDPPPDDTASSIGSTEAEFSEFWENRFAKPRGTRSSRFLERVNRQKRPTAEEYAAMWQMYDQRALKEEAAPPLGPVMHFGNTHGGPPH